LFSSLSPLTLASLVQPPNYSVLGSDGVSVTGDVNRVSPDVKVYVRAGLEFWRWNRLSKAERIKLEDDRSMVESMQFVNEEKIRREKILGALRSGEVACDDTITGRNVWEVEPIEDRIKAAREESEAFLKSLETIGT